MKCVQGHSSQLAGIFHTIRERFNNTISVKPLKFKVIQLELKKTLTNYGFKYSSHENINLQKNLVHTKSKYFRSAVLKHEPVSFFLALYQLHTILPIYKQIPLKASRLLQITTNKLKHSTGSGHAISTNIRRPNTC